jgi:hypothetical protein
MDRPAAQLFELHGGAMSTASMIMAGVQIAALVATGGVGYTLGSSKATATYQAAIAVRDATIATQATDHSEALRRAEAAASARIAVIDTNHQTELQNAKTKVADLDAAVAAGAVRLRQRFTCPVAPAGAAAPVDSAGIGDGTQGSGLSTADARFLISEAARADEVALQLRACQAVIRADRTTNPLDHEAP